MTSQLIKSSTLQKQIGDLEKHSTQENVKIIDHYYQLLNTNNRKFRDFQGEMKFNES